MEQFIIDSIDLQLLDQLQRDASLSNQALAAQVNISPPTCLRRVKRLRDAGLIERNIAILSVDKLADVLGHGLCAIVEITLDRQDNAALERFEQGYATMWAANAKLIFYEYKILGRYCLVSSMKFWISLNLMQAN